ncbi:MAG: Asp23/Gls24 family envelope stress response protein [Chloroflexi bacterium]|nr:Asp23/Gls24 family envelope stress response protein [Chloroflexota bacterium]GIW11381.1 MAG: hypothetical protein KatS3mg061_2438 [Dehalococcoidia bacterium]
MNPDTREVAGEVHVSPVVIRSLAALSAAAVPGVVAVGRHRVPFRPRPFGGPPHDGVRVHLQEKNVVTVDLDLTVDGSANLVEVGRRVQREVTEAIEQTVGFPVRAVNVRIQDVA